MVDSKLQIAHWLKEKMQNDYIEGTAWSDEESDQDIRKPEALKLTLSGNRYEYLRKSYWPSSDSDDAVASSDKNVTFYYRGMVNTQRLKKQTHSRRMIRNQYLLRIQPGYSRE